MLQCFRAPTGLLARHHTPQSASDYLPCFFSYTMKKSQKELFTRDVSVPSEIMPSHRLHSTDSLKASCLGLMESVQPQH